MLAKHAGVTTSLVGYSAAHHPSLWFFVMQLQLGQSQLEIIKLSGGFLCFRLQCANASTISLRILADGPVQGLPPSFLPMA